MAANSHKIAGDFSEDLDAFLEEIQADLASESPGLYDEGNLIGIWMVSRLKKMKVFRGIGMCVDKSARKHGIGRSICDQMKALSDTEKRMLTFDCKAHNPAIAFWRKMGFTETGTRRRGKQQELYRRFVYIPKSSAPVAQG